MYKIGVIGDKDSVMGFLALGLTVFETSGAEQTAELIRRAAAEGYAAIYITEQAAQDVMDVIDEYKDSELPGNHPDSGDSGQPWHRHGGREKERRARSRGGHTV